jgi:hypothetical protein
MERGRLPTLGPQSGAMRTIPAPCYAERASSAYPDPWRTRRRGLAQPFGKAQICVLPPRMPRAYVQCLGRLLLAGSGVAVWTFGKLAEGLCAYHTTYAGGPRPNAEQAAAQHPRPRANRVRIATAWASGNLPARGRRRVPCGTR